MMNDLYVWYQSSWLAVTFSALLADDVRLKTVMACVTPLNASTNGTAANVERVSRMPMMRWSSLYTNEASMPKLGRTSGSMLAKNCFVYWFVKPGSLAILARGSVVLSRMSYFAVTGLYR